MDRYTFKRQMFGFVLLSVVALAACGGGGSDPPVPVVEIITVRKVIPIEINAGATEVRQVASAGINIVEVRCKRLSFPVLVPGFATTGSFDLVLLLDVAAADVEKTKAFGFSPFTEDEKARAFLGICN